MHRTHLRVIYGDGEDIEEEEGIDIDDEKEVAEAIERWHPSRGPKPEPKLS